MQTEINDLKEEIMQLKEHIKSIRRTVFLNGISIILLVVAVIVHALIGH